MDDNGRRGRTLALIGLRLEAGFHAFSTVLAGLAALAVLGLLLVSTAEVVSRQTGGQGFRGAVEYGEIFLVLVTLLSLAAAYRHGVHVQADFVTRRLPKRVSAAIQAAGLIAVVAVLLVLVHASASVAVESLRTGEYRIGLVQAPLWPARFAVPLGFAALLLEMSAELTRHLVVTAGRLPSDGSTSTSSASSPRERMRSHHTTPGFETGSPGERRWIR